MFNPFKKTKRVPASAPKPRPARATGSEKPAPERTKAGAKERRSIGVITAPHQTEKAAGGVPGGWYAFRVRADADKATVRRAVEERYGVSVRRVRMLHVRPKAVRLGRIRGTTPGFKKAMVKVGEGQAIEFTS